MDLIMELSEITGLPVQVAVGSYRYSVIGGKAVHISGLKSILAFSDEGAVLLMQKGKKLVVKGSEFLIKKMQGSDIVITGKILSVTEE